MEDRALDHPLEAERRLGIDLVIASDGRGVLGDELQQFAPQLVDVGGASAQHLGGGGVVEQRQQQVLDGDELVALLSCLDKGHVQADFQFLRNHQLSSITHASGC